MKRVPHCFPKVLVEGAAGWELDRGFVGESV